MTLEENTALVSGRFAALTWVQSLLAPSTRYAYAAELNLLLPALSRCDRLGWFLCGLQPRKPRVVVTPAGSTP